MDVGKAVGQFEIKGLTKSINELKHFQEVLNTVAFDYKKQRKEQALVVQGFKSQSPAVKAVIGNQRYFAGSLRKTTEALKRQQTELKTATQLIQVHKDALKMSVHPMVDLSAVDKSAAFFTQLSANVTRLKTGFMQLSYGAKRLSASLIRIAATSTVRTLSDFYHWTKKGLGVIASFVRGVNRVYKALRRLLHLEHSSGIHEGGWWSRFGSVAAGFAVAYRAINAVEYALRNLSHTFASGLTALDNYKQSIVTISGMLSLLSKGGNYESRFAVFHKAMQGTMLESIRLAPMFKLSVEEIGDAYKELSQFGVVISKKTVKPTLTAIAAIKEIATTTQSSSRQIRQEIQAIFNGQARVTDQFSRFARRFPEIRKALFGINKLTTSNAEKWRLAFTVMEKYFLAIQESNKTLSAQYTIARNKLSLISMTALESSGVFKKWLGTLTSINERIIDSEGHLGDLGAKAIRYFGYVWQLLDKIIVLAGKVGSHVLGYVKQWHKMTQNIDTFRLHVIKGYASMMMFLGGLKAILAMGRFTFGHLTNKLTVLVATIVYGKSMLDEFNTIKFPRFKSFLTLMSTILKKSWDVLQKIILGLTMVGEHPMLIGTAIKFKAISTEVWDKWRVDVLADIDTVSEQIKAAGKKQLEYLYKQFSAQGYTGTTLAAKMEAGRLAFEKQLRRMVKDAHQAKMKLKPIWDDYFGAGTVSENLAKNMHRLYDDTIVKHTKSIIQRGNEHFEEIFAKWFNLITGLNKKDLKITFKGLDPKDWEKAFKAMDKGIENTGIHFNDFNKKVVEFKTKTKAVFEYVGDYFSKFVGDTIRGEIHSLTDLINGFLNTIRDAFAQAFQDIAADMIKTFVRNRIGGVTLSGFLGGFFTSKPAYAGPTPSGVAGSGAAWGGVETIAMASGGLLTEPVFGIGASGRAYTFAEAGPERILSNSDSFARPETNVVVNVINKSSTPVDAHIGDTRRQLKSLVTEVILEDRRRGGVISRG